MSKQNNNLHRCSVSFESIISNLKAFWGSKSCSTLESFDIEVGAGTLAPNTALKLLEHKNWNVCYVQKSRRPSDGRFGDGYNRLSFYYQFQVVMKPYPKCVDDLFLESLQSIGFDVSKIDVKFIEDDWENPSIGAYGRGFEIWINGIEVTQFTYMKTILSKDLNQEAIEITYGLERIAMFLQNKNNISDLVWSNQNNKNILYGDIHSIHEEKNMCYYYKEYNLDTDFIKTSLSNHLETAKNLHNEYLNFNSKNKSKNDNELMLSVYEQCLKANMCLNILDARSVISKDTKKKKISEIQKHMKYVILKNKSNK